MNFTVVFVFMCCLIGFFTVSVYGEEVRQELPVYPPKILVVGDNGKVFTRRKSPTLEFKKVYLNLDADKKSSTGYLIPENLIIASKLFRQSMPPKLYMNLMCGYKDVVVLGYSEKYPAMDERFSDLARFFIQVWDLKRNTYLVNDYEKRKDYLELFEGFLDSLKEYDKTLACSGG